jgi:hypothetical protein|nr:MAG TPA: hypothetical protein [Caudoviricetes sp.]
MEMATFHPEGFYCLGCILIFFKRKIDRAVSCGGLVKDLRHGMPEFDWMNDNGYCLHHSKIEYWAYMPIPPTED